MKTEHTTSETIDIEADLEALESFNVIHLIQRALPSFGIILLIGLGTIINVGLGLVFFWKNLAEWQQAFKILMVFVVVFPVLYLVFTIYYGRLVMIWQAYQQFLRAFIGKLYMLVLDELIPTNTDKNTSNRDWDDMIERHNNRPLNAPPTIEEQEIADKLKQYQNKFANKIPGFLQGFTKIFFSVGELVTVLRSLFNANEGKETIKGKAFVHLMNACDEQMAQYQPSFRWAIVLVIINIGAAFWLF